MEIIAYLLYFGIIPTDIETKNIKNISFSENIDYCTNIIHDPTKEFEFYQNCNIDETNKYIITVKRGI